jgi:hypothetical protein
LERGWGQREEFSLIPSNKEKWTEAGMWTWGGDGDRGKNCFLIPDNQCCGTGIGTIGTVNGRILSNSSQQRKWIETAWGLGEGLVIEGRILSTD